MQHRGPDGRGSFSDDAVFLGHRRLAIIDLSDAGKQPMVSHDDNNVIIFNGEIYNYIELREVLEKEGVEFRTESDTEVLLELVSRRGPKAIPLLNGMFGFVLWNEEKRELLAVRDRIGIKPLYYFQSQDYIAIASEIGPLLPLLDEIAINDAIVFDFLQRKRVEHSASTFFEGIHQVPPGHYLTTGPKGIQIHRWYNLVDAVHIIQNKEEFQKRSESDHIKEVRRRFQRSVELRLRSDVPVGSCLSGGIDSSSIVVTAAGMIDRENLKNFQTYSAVFGDWYEKDEKRYIESVLELSGIQGNFTIPTATKLSQSFGDFIRHQEEPVTGASPFSQYSVMKLAKEHGAKVLLDGQGADEILAGYDYMVGYYFAALLFGGKIPAFLREVFAQVRRRNKIFLRSFLSHFMPSWLQRYIYSRRHNLMKREFWERFRNRSVLKPIVPKPPRLRGALIEYVSKNIQHLLKWEDRNSMAFSIETRIPFLDPDFMEYVLALPPEYAIRNGVTKWVLRNAFAHKIPPKIAKRKDKVGFATPERAWLASGQVVQVNRLIEQQHPLLGNYIDMDVLEQMLLKGLSSLGPNTLNYIFRITALNVWLTEFFPPK